MEGGAREALELAGSHGVAHYGLVEPKGVEAWGDLLLLGKDYHLLSPVADPPMWSTSVMDMLPHLREKINNSPESTNNPAHGDS